MGTFSPETCLELVPTLTRQQVDREYIYFGGTVDLPTKDKRFKLREYLVNLRDAQKAVPATSEYASSTAGMYTGTSADQTSYLTSTVQALDTSSAQSSAYMYQAAAPPAPETYVTQTSSESYGTATATTTGSETQFDTLNNLCHQINANVLQLKFDFASYAEGRGAGAGCYDTVDMDLSDQGEDMEMSDCDMGQDGDVNGSKSQM